MKRAWKYIARYRFTMLLALGLSALGSIAGLFAPIITQNALDNAIPAGDRKQLVTLVLLLIGVYAVSVLMVTLRSRMMVKVSQKIIYDIRRDLFAHLQRLSFQYYDDRPHGKILIRVVNYVNSVSDMLSNGLINMIL